MVEAGKVMWRVGPSWKQSQYKQFPGYENRFRPVILGDRSFLFAPSDDRSDMCVYELEVQNKVAEWVKLTVSNPPKWRLDPVLTSVGDNSIVLLGGTLNGQKLKDCHVLSVDRHVIRWKSWGDGRNMPHSGIRFSVGHQGRLVVFNNFRLVSCFDIRKNIWTHLTDVDESVPPLKPLKSGDATPVEGKKPKADGDCPIVCSLEGADENKILILCPMEDTGQAAYTAEINFEGKSVRYERLPSSTPLPTRCLGGVAFWCSELRKVVIAGGQGRKRQWVSDLHTFDPLSLEFEETVAVPAISAGAMPNDDVALTVRTQSTIVEVIPQQMTDLPAVFSLNFLEKKYSVEAQKEAAGKVASAYLRWHTRQRVHAQKGRKDSIRLADMKHQEEKTRKYSVISAQALSESQIRRVQGHQGKHSDLKKIKPSSSMAKVLRNGDVAPTRTAYVAMLGNGHDGYKLADSEWWEAQSLTISPPQAAPGEDKVNWDLASETLVECLRNAGDVRLSSLTLSRWRILRGLEGICNWLKLWSFEFLRELNLADCRIGDDGMVLLVRGLGVPVGDEVGSELGEGAGPQLTDRTAASGSVGTGNHVAELISRLDLSRNDIRHSGARLVSLLLRQLRQLQWLNLSGNHIAQDGSMMIAESLTLNPALTYLDFGYNQVEADGAASIATLMLSSPLKTLILDSNPLGDKGASHILGTMEQESDRVQLEELALSHTKITCESLGTLADIIYMSNTLQVLQLHGNETFLTTDHDTDLLKLGSALKENKSLRSVNLGRMNIKLAIKPICSAFYVTGGSLITSLSLSYSAVDVRGFKYLAKVMAANTTLLSLVLDGTDLTDLGMEYLASGIALNTSVEALDLSCNSISDKGCGLLSVALTTNKSLKKISLAKNDFGDDGCLQLVSALDSNDTLVYIDLAHNKVTPIAGTDICNFLESSLDNSHFSPLETIDMTGTTIGVVLSKRIKKLLLERSLGKAREGGAAGGNHVKEMNVISSRNSWMLSRSAPKLPEPSESGKQLKDGVVPLVQGFDSWLFPQGDQIHSWDLGDKYLKLVEGYNTAILDDQIVRSRNLASYALLELVMMDCETESEFSEADQIRFAVGTAKEIQCPIDKVKVTRISIVEDELIAEVCIYGTQDRSAQELLDVLTHSINSQRFEHETGFSVALNDRVSPVALVPDMYDFHSPVKPEDLCVRRAPGHWTTVNLFISTPPSASFDAEREYLNRCVLPALRRKCLSRNVYLREVDLNRAKPTANGKSYFYCQGSPRQRIREIRPIENGKTLEDVVNKCRIGHYEITSGTGATSPRVKSANPEAEAKGETVPTSARRSMRSASLKASNTPRGTTPRRRVKAGLTPRTDGKSGGAGTSKLPTANPGQKFYLTVLPDPLLIHPTSSEETQGVMLDEFKRELRAIGCGTASNSEGVVLCRKPSLTGAVVEEATAVDGAIEQLRGDVWNSVKASDKPERIYSYHCSMAREGSGEADPGVNIFGLEQFGMTAFTQLWALLERYYPQPTGFIVDVPQTVHMYAPGERQKRAPTFIGFSKELEALKSYVTSPVLEPLLVTGSAGCGCTSLLTHFASAYSDILQKPKPESGSGAQVDPANTTPLLVTFFRSPTQTLDDCFMDVWGAVAEIEIPTEDDEDEGEGQHAELPEMELDKSTEWKMEVLTKTSIKASTIRPLVFIIDGFDGLDAEFLLMFATAACEDTGSIKVILSTRQPFVLDNISVQTLFVEGLEEEERRVAVFGEELASSSSVSLQGLSGDKERSSVHSSTTPGPSAKSTTATGSKGSSRGTPRSPRFQASLAPDRPPTNPAVEQCLKENPGASSPLFCQFVDTLQSLCDPWGKDGDKRRASKKHDADGGFFNWLKLPHSTEELIAETVFAYLERNHTAVFVERALCLLACARDGLREQELQLMVGGPFPGTSPLTDAEFYSVMDDLETCKVILNRPYINDDLVCLSSSAVREAVRIRYGGEDQDQVAEWERRNHFILGEFFLHEISPDGTNNFTSAYVRGIQLAPYHVVRAGPPMYNQLGDLILSFNFVRIYLTSLEVSTLWNEVLHLAYTNIDDQIHGHQSDDEKSDAESDDSESVARADEDDGMDHPRNSGPWLLTRISAWMHFCESFVKELAEDPVPVYELMQTDVIDPDQKPRPSLVKQAQEDTDKVHDLIDEMELILSRSSLGPEGPLAHYVKFHDLRERLQCVLDSGIRALVSETRREQLDQLNSELESRQRNSAMELVFPQIKEEFHPSDPATIRRVIAWLKEIIGREAEKKLTESTAAVTRQVTTYAVTWEKATADNGRALIGAGEDGAIDAMMGVLSMLLKWGYDRQNGRVMLCALRILSKLTLSAQDSVRTLLHKSKATREQLLTTCSDVLKKLTKSEALQEETVTLLLRLVELSAEVHAMIAKLQPIYALRDTFQAYPSNVVIQQHGASLITILSESEK